jgi:hypothetical protein
MPGVEEEIDRYSDSGRRAKYSDVKWFVIETEKN